MSKYKDAGVDVDAGYEAVSLIKNHVSATFRPEVLTGIGGFGGLFQTDFGKYKDPVLVSGTDGVGTKLKISFLLKKYDTVGIDCVAMCVNDIICSGAEPLFFLDYIATGKIYPEKISEIVKGISNGCIQAGCSLIGGETAEMPGFYSESEFDLAGFAVGVVNKEDIIDGATIKKGDVLIGLPSSGVHSNGFSLIRKIFNPTREKLSEHVTDLKCTLGEELLKPTRIYVNIIRDLIKSFEIKGISHITGGGFIENIPRMGSQSLEWDVETGSWPVPPIFKLMKRLWDMENDDLYSTFNMGIGMVLAVSQEMANEVIKYLNSKGEEAYIIGKVSEGIPGVKIC
ncbi:MAG: phosphoribosylformylglycinamidine cyclo-ligase [Clostridiales bacterium]|jgi:phosphoribosylformylglycinamidine cyclo-ligase|nr:phosphoribosylformylglycinamidine cyclo-ligase [Clostridiales bacterium]